MENHALWVNDGGDWFFRVLFDVGQKKFVWYEHKTRHEHRLKEPGNFLTKVSIMFLFTNLRPSAGGIGGEDLLTINASQPLPEPAADVVVVADHLDDEGVALPLNRDKAPAQPGAALVDAGTQLAQAKAGVDMGSPKAAGVA